MSIKDVRTTFTTTGLMMEYSGVLFRLSFRFTSDWVRLDGNFQKFILEKIGYFEGLRNEVIAWAATFHRANMWAGNGYLREEDCIESLETYYQTKWGEFIADMTTRRLTK